MILRLEFEKSSKLTKLLKYSNSNKNLQNVDQQQRFWSTLPCKHLCRHLPKSLVHCKHQKNIHSGSSCQRNSRNNRDGII